MALKAPIEKGWITQGVEVAGFEKDFQTKYQVEHAIAVTSCTTGLHLILSSLGVGPGDEVIVPSFTWVATANSVLYCGAKPVFVDIDLTTFNIDPSEVASKINADTKAIIAVHLFGLPADMDTLNEIAGSIPVIEDAACAVGAKLNGKYTGSLGKAASFSFHPRKVITTGEGGMVTTNSKELANIMTQKRNHGAVISEEQRHNGPQPYLLPDFDHLGYNYRMTDLQGAIGKVQLKKVDQLIADRAQMASSYMDSLSNISWLTLPNPDESVSHSWQSFVCLVDEDKSPGTRNEIMAHLEQKGISTRPGTHAIHTLNYYKDLFGFSDDDFPNSRIAAEKSMAIPLHNKMSDHDFHRVVRALKDL